MFERFDSYRSLKCGFSPQVENKCAEEVNVLTCRVIKLHNLLTDVISYKHQNRIDDFLPSLVHYGTCMPPSLEVSGDSRLVPQLISHRRATGISGSVFNPPPEKRQSLVTCR
ncbi:Hypothetical predicted protein [Scomber scombrus]|uniref:Uncharacterized protein n=1 Tax=Scomber scombrus TaxID=13677 RepID=A0AAV1Q9U1_SCOSC